MVGMVFYYLNTEERKKRGAVNRKKPCKNHPPPSPGIGSLVGVGVEGAALNPHCNPQRACRSLSCHANGWAHRRRLTARNGG